jgi:hypothetical protein
MPSPSTAASGKPRHTDSSNLEATIKIDIPKRTASAPSAVHAGPPRIAPSSETQATPKVERRNSPQRAAIGQRMAILMEQEAMAREAERLRTRRWLIGGTAALVGIIVMPLMFSAMSSKKPAAAPSKPAIERPAPAK